MANLQSLRKRMTESQGQEYDRLTAEHKPSGRAIAWTSSNVTQLSRRLADGITLKPTLDRVLVMYEETAGQTKGGLFLPQSADIRKAGQSYPARVIAVGPGRWGRKDKTMFRRFPMSYAPGDRVMAPCLNFPLYVDGKECYLVNEDALLGKLLAVAKAQKWSTSLPNTSRHSGRMKEARKIRNGDMTKISECEDCGAKLVGESMAIRTCDACEAKRWNKAGARAQF